MKVKNSMQMIKAAVYKYGPISRSKLAELLDVTPPTVTNNISTLISEGLVAEAACSDSPSIGRKPIDVDYIPDARYAVGVELSPYFTSIAVCDLKGRCLIKKRYPTAPLDYGVMLEELVSWLNETMDESRISPDRFIGVGVGTPGFIEQDKQTIRQCFRASWNGKNLSKDLSELLPLPVATVNNAQVRAVGVDLLDSSVRGDMFAYFYVSYGIACPLVVKNGIFSSQILGAGEIGHMTMDPNGRQCDVCGKQGCLEAYASERAILRRCHEAMSLGMNSILPELSQNPEEFTIKDVLKAQAAGDQMVCHIMNDALLYLGMAVANIINFISPPLLLIDAYMMKSEQNRSQLLSVIYKNVYSFNNNEIDIRFVDYDAYISAAGAAAYVTETFFIHS